MTWLFLKKKMVAFTQWCLVPSLVEFRLLCWRIWCFQKRSVYFYYFVIISPCACLNRLEFFYPCIPAGTWVEIVFVYLHLQNGVVSRYQRLSFFHAEFFCIFRVCAIWNVLPTRVIMPHTHPPPFEKCNLYSIPYISWMNYSRVAFGDEAKFSVSVFVQNH